MASMAELELMKLKDRYYALDISSPRYYRRSVEIVLGLSKVNLKICGEVDKPRVSCMINKIIFLRDHTHKDLNMKLTVIEDLYYQLRAQKDPSIQCDFEEDEDKEGDSWTATELGDYLCQVRDDLTEYVTEQLLSMGRFNIKKE